MRKSGLRWYSILINIVAVLLVLLSILIMLRTVRSLKRIMQQEHYDHVLALSQSIDHNLNIILNRVREELQLGALRSKSDEALMLEGNSTGVLNRLTDMVDMETNCLDMILIVRDGGILACTECGDDCGFSFPLGWDPEEPCLCVDDDGENSYLAVSVPSENGNGLYYTGLLDLRETYERVASGALPDDYWFVFYDVQLGLVLQTDDWQPAYFQMTYEEAMARNDGISALAESERKQLIGATNYLFTYPDGRTIHYLIATVPASQTENGIFAVGVSVNCEDYLRNHRNFTIHMSAFAIMFIMGAIVLSWGSAHSYRKRRETEQRAESLRLRAETLEQEAHHQRLELIGTMTSSISHEFNNLLTPIMGDSLLSMEKLPEGNEEILENLTEIYEASDRAKELVSRIAALSRVNDRKVYKHIAPDTLVEQVIRAAKPSLPPFVETRTELHCPELRIFVDETQIAQLLLNLVINAYQAMEGSGGTLTVSTRQNGEFVEFRLKDTGPGIPPDILEKMFNPFFTTKEPGKGTGLGLPIVQRIVTDHHGSIRVESEPGQGTTFVVTIPIETDTKIETE